MIDNTTPQKTKVAFFADILTKDFDGASRTMFQIIERIPSNKFEFLFFCGLPPAHDIGFEVVQIPTMSIPFNNKYKLAIPFFHIHKMKQKLAEFQPDVIHIASPSPLGNFALDYKKAHNIPALSMYHTHFISYVDYYLKSMPLISKPITKTVAYGQKVFYNKSDMMLIPTQQIIDELTEYGFDKSKMRIWQRGINHETFNPTKKDIAYIQGITKNDKPNILFASRLVWEKNLATLIRLYRLHEKNEHKYNFIIAGDGPASEALKEKMPNAYHLGKVTHEELATLYASSDVFVFPSISETYGNVVIEAMASGCPCVIARGGGSQSLIEHEKNGFLCTPNDEKEYLDHIETILTNEPMRKAIIEEGYAYTASLNWDTLVSTYLDNLLELKAQKAISKTS